ncbi:MAG: carbon-nitrogen hydrolase family protein [Myxococcota bacterium]
MSASSVHVAIVQTHPAHLDLDGSIARVIDGASRARKEGATLVVFGESFLSGYPKWLDVARGAALWDHEPTRAAFARLRSNALRIESPESSRLAKLAAELGIFLILGAHERVDSGPGNGTLYNALLGWNPEGSLVLHHRKLVPTYTEKLVWGPGDAHGLRAAPTSVGRVGGLICWEHWMPLARQALHESGEDIHVALWPTVAGPHQTASKAYAFEGRCFVLAAGTLTRAGDLPEEFRADIEEDDDTLLIRGGSAIVGPDGEFLVEPVMDRDTIVHAELDLRRIDKERLTLDVTGHYARPDIFQFAVNRSPRGRDS